MDNIKFNSSQQQTSKESTHAQQQQLASTAIPWLISNGSVQQAAAATSRPSGERRKWCGCDPGSQCVQCRFLHLEPEVQQQAASQDDESSRAVMEMESVYSNKASAGAGTASLYRHVMSSSSEDAAAAAAAVVASRGIAAGKTLLELGQSDQTANTSSDLIQQVDGGDGSDQQENQSCNRHLWQISRLKTDICLHPLRDQLLSAHLACLRVATPVDQIPHIEAQAARASQTLAKYTMFSENHILVGHEKEELDHFMAQYVLLLCTFKEQLQQHVRFHANEAVMACYELEQCLLSLTGVSSGGANTGATMSDDDDMEDEQAGESDILYSDSDCGGASAYGSLIPSETERTLMERVRQELKRELQLGYKDRIVDVREEILRKRRAGKLPGDTTSVLKAWWQSHSKWPYPTEDEKMRLVQETGLQLKQINNWFINQRKRNWHNNPSSSLGALKSKRKR